MKRKAQQSGTSAAMLVGIIALLIVFYILFLPPDERAKLLGEEPSSSASASSSYSSTQKDTESKQEVDTSEKLLLASPGRIDYNALDEYEYTLPAFYLYKSRDSMVIESIGHFYIRNGWFDTVTKEMDFEVKDLENTDNFILTISVGKKQGRLIVKVNGNELYNYEPPQLNVEPIKISKQYLNEGLNTIELSVSDVGMAFWTTNEYSVDNAKLTADYTDISRQESRNYFYLTEEEGRNIKSAVLKFNPDCQSSETGTLLVFLNNVQVFSGIPDCGILNSYMISPSVLNTGKNTIKFATEEGSYLIDQISVNTRLEEPVHPTYYFELDEDLFETKVEDTHRCGDIDGKCPNNCDEDLDRDCCFEEYSDSYWCDVPTGIEGDRCVGYVESSQCGRCPSGYEDKNGNAADACEDMCGDDKDGECPAGCLTYYDRDCCFELDGDQYWCNDLPVTGVAYACVNEVTRNNCRNCASGYDGEGLDPSCDYSVDDEKDDKLDDEYSLVLVFEFTEKGSEKEAVIWVNNHETGFDTRESKWIKNIDAYVRPYTNSIKIMPKSELEIAEIRVEFD